MVLPRTRSLVSATESEAETSASTSIQLSDFLHKSFHLQRVFQLDRGYQSLPVKELHNERNQLGRRDPRHQLESSQTPLSTMAGKSSCLEPAESCNKATKRKVGNNRNEVGYGNLATLLPMIQLRRRTKMVTTLAPANNCDYWPKKTMMECTYPNITAGVFVGRNSFDARQCVIQPP